MEMTRDCHDCSGTGKALSSLDVVSFQSRSLLDEHGLAAAFKIVTEGA